jgi:hypothetical protein
MATHQSKAILRANWLRGWELMRAGRTSEGYDLLAGVKLSDFAAVSDAERPERIFFRVQSIIERQPCAEAAADGTVMDALICAAKRGDQEASDLLIFVDME